MENRNLIFLCNVAIALVVLGYNSFEVSKLRVVTEITKWLGKNALL